MFFMLEEKHHEKFRNKIVKKFYVRRQPEKDFILVYI